MKKGRKRRKTNIPFVLDSSIFWCCPVCCRIDQDSLSSKWQKRSGRSSFPGTFRLLLFGAEEEMKRATKKKEVVLYLQVDQ